MHQLHTSDLNDGYDWGRLNLQSVTEQSNLDDFLTTAQLAGTEFTAGNRCSPTSEVKLIIFIHSDQTSQWYIFIGNKCKPTLITCWTKLVI